MLLEPFLAQAAPLCSQRDPSRDATRRMLDWGLLCLVEKEIEVAGLFQPRRADSLSTRQAPQQRATASQGQGSVKEVETRRSARQ